MQTIDTNDFVKKADYNKKIDETVQKIPDHNRYITTPEFDKLTMKNFTVRLK